MNSTIKRLLSLAILALASGCGGGSTTSYQIMFVGTVTGLPSGQQLTLLGTLPTTGQSVPITITQNGAFSSQITLPAGYDLTNSGTAKVIISQQPSTVKCSINIATTSTITVNCANVIGAAGFYSGSLTTPTLTSGIGLAFIQNNGNYWIIAGNTDSTTLASSYSAIVSGTGSSTSTAFTSNNGVDIFSNPQIVNAAISAAYQSLSTFIGSLTTGSTSFSLSLTAAPSYSFNATPLLSTLAGTYNLSLNSKSPTDTITISIGANGSFNGTTAKGCAITGSSAPMTTGENAYNFSINYGLFPCANPSTTQTGTVVLLPTTLGTQMVGGVFSSGLTDGTLLISTKQ